VGGFSLDFEAVRTESSDRDAPRRYDADKAGAGRDAAKQCLWACLDAGLRLLHPLCPFVTEELWQRLPRTFAVSSIMVAPYPSPSEVDTFDDQEAERGTSLVLETVTGARSLRAQYSLANKPAHFHCVFSNDSERASILEGRKDDCSTLMRAASVTIGNDITPPKGCGQKLVDDKLSVLVDLKGLVDADAEIKKLQKELKTVEPLVAKLQAKITDARYLAKAPEKQRSQDREKLKSYGDKAAAARAAIKSWEEFKSGGGEEDDDDFWAEDDEDDPAAAKALEEAKAKAMAKLAKKEANQRSLCNLEIKPWEADQDLKALYAKIKATVVKDG
jgi:valyl-tRNA synthetase